MSKTPLEFSRDKPMSTKGWFNVSRDVLEYTAMGGGKYNLIVKSFSLSNTGKLFLEEYQQQQKRTTKKHMGLRNMHLYMLLGYIRPLLESVH